MNCYAAYEDYYKNQAIQSGNGIAFFSGPRYQKGNGLGSIFSGLLRYAMPVLSKTAKAVGKNVLKTGAAVASDVISGQKLSNSLKNRSRETIGRLVNNIGTHSNKKPVNKRRGPSIKRGGKRRRPPGISSKRFSKDIFN